MPLSYYCYGIVKFKHRQNPLDTVALTLLVKLPILTCGEPSSAEGKPFYPAHYCMSVRLKASTTTGKSLLTATTTPQAADAPRAGWLWTPEAVAHPP